MRLAGLDLTNCNIMDGLSVLIEGPFNFLGVTPDINHICIISVYVIFKIGHRFMKTYMTVLRAILMLISISSLALGVLFSYQHWDGSDNLLWIGLLLFMIMVGDHYFNKRVHIRRKEDLSDRD